MMHGGSLDVRVVALDARLEPQWDAFVRDQEAGTFYHLSGWRHVFARAFGHDCPYLVALAGDRVVGVLPLVHLKTPLFGNRLVSTAFLVYGGPVAIDHRVRAALTGAAVERAEALGVSHLEYRSLVPGEEGRDWQVESARYATFFKDLHDTDEANLKAIPRKQRAEVRKGIKAGLTSEVAGDVDLLHHFLALSFRNLGTPAFSKRYLRTILDVFGDAAELLTIQAPAGPVGAVLSFHFRDQVLPYYSGTQVEARAQGVNDFLYWEVMRRAVARGARRFDFGRSKVDTGPYKFKKYWGFEPVPLHYEYRLVRATEVPDASPMNPKYRLAIAAWKRLPLPVSKRLGPLLSWQLG